MRDKLRTLQFQIGFAIFGGLGGFLYWKFIGCESGTCPIKSVWYWTTLWGIAFGYLLGDFVYGVIKKKWEHKKNDEREV